MTLILPPGKVRGLLPRQTVFGSVCPLLREHVQVIPRGEWADLIPQQEGLRGHVNHIFDQRQEGSCAAESATQAVQITRNVAGYEFVLLNPWSVYAYTKIGGGGSTLDDNLVRVREHGIAPMEMWPRSKGLAKLPADVAEAAKEYRLDEFFEIGSAEEAGTALLLGFAVVFGWDGHSCAFTRLLDDRGNCEYVNSWKESWGDHGFGKLNLSRVQWNYGMFAYRNTITPMA